MTKPHSNINNLVPMCNKRCQGKFFIVEHCSSHIFLFSKIDSHLFVIKRPQKQRTAMPGNGLQLFEALTITNCHLYLLHSLYFLALLLPASQPNSSVFKLSLHHTHSSCVWSTDLSFSKFWYLTSTFGINDLLLFNVLPQSANLQDHLVRSCVPTNNLHICKT